MERRVRIEETCGLGHGRVVARVRLASPLEVRVRFVLAQGGPRTPSSDQYSMPVMDTKGGTARESTPLVAKPAPPLLPPASLTPPAGASGPGGMDEERWAEKQRRLVNQHRNAILAGFVGCMVTHPAMGSGRGRQSSGIMRNFAQVEDSKQDMGECFEKRADTLVGLRRPHGLQRPRGLRRRRGLRRPSVSHRWAGWQTRRHASTTWLALAPWRASTSWHPPVPCHVPTTRCDMGLQWPQCCAPVRRRRRLPRLHGMRRCDGGRRPKGFSHMARADSP